MQTGACLSFSLCEFLMHSCHLQPSESSVLSTVLSTVVTTFAQSICFKACHRVLVHSRESLCRRHGVIVLVASLL